MDMYVYPFGDPGRPVVLKDVSYGAVSAYVAVVARMLIEPRLRL